MAQRTRNTGFDSKTSESCEYRRNWSLCRLSFPGAIAWQLVKPSKERKLRRDDSIGKAVACAGPVEDLHSRFSGGRGSLGFSGRVNRQKAGGNSCEPLDELVVSVAVCPTALGLVMPQFCTGKRKEDGLEKTNNGQNPSSKHER